MSEDTERHIAILARLDRIIELLEAIVYEGAQNMTTVDDILAEVTAEQSIDSGLLALINNLIANQNDPTKLAAILSGMKANIAPLVTALAQNTPAPAPAPAPAPTDNTAAQTPPTDTTGQPAAAS